MKRKLRINPLHRLALLTLFLLSQPISAATAGTIEIVTEKLRNDRGMIRVCLWNSPAGFPDGSSGKPKQCVEKPAAQRSAVLRFDQIPPGKYAISAFHDENANGRLDVSALGIPMEGVALVIDGKAVVPPPTYEQSTVTVGNAVKRVVLGFVYF